MESEKSLLPAMIEEGLGGGDLLPEGLSGGDLLSEGLGRGDLLPEGLSAGESGCDHPAAYGPNVAPAPLSSFETRVGAACGMPQNVMEKRSKYLPTVIEGGANLDLDMAPTITEGELGGGDGESGTAIFYVSER